MNARRIAQVLAVATLVGAGSYLFLYLYRWEWNRALTAGIFVLVAEIALATSAILGRISRLERKLEAAGTASTRPASRSAAAARPIDVRVLRRMQESTPTTRDHFAWLASSTDENRSNVFVPVLMGAGVVMSALAWVVERLARSTAGPALERGLVRKFEPLTLDLPEGLVPAPPAAADVPPILLGPGRRP
jgi:hypothetical protein